MISLSKIAVVDNKSGGGLTCHALSAVAFYDLTASCPVPSQGIRQERSSTLPVSVSLTAILYAVAFTKCFTRWTVKQFRSFVFSFAASRTVCVSVVTKKLRFAMGAALQALRGLAMLQRRIREMTGSAFLRTGCRVSKKRHSALRAILLTRDITTFGPIGTASLPVPVASLAAKIMRVFLQLVWCSADCLSARFAVNQYAKIVISHVTPLGRIGQGPASVTSAIGACSYFPISGAAVQA